MRCHDIPDAELGRIHIPGCMGCAVYGHEQCTCPPRPRRVDLEARVDKLEARLRVLEQRAGKEHGR